MIKIKARIYSFFIVLITAVMFLAPEALQAKHIIGGEVYYDCLGIDSSGNQKLATFQITFNMYRDCFGGGAAFDDPARFGLYSGSGSNWNWQETFFAPVTSESFLPINDDPCVEEPTDVCVEKGVYVFEITVPVINESYLLTYQRCCRNNTIVNIENPESTGAVFQVEISPLAQQICNDSPTFDNFPPIVICANTPLVFDHKASDNEGHELVYELCTPITSGGTLGTNENPGDPNSCFGVTPNPQLCLPTYDDVIFKLPDFSSQNPLGVAAGTTINTFSGLLTANPTITGQFVVGVCVKEYRNGELLSVVQRDFQFNVTQCQILVYADVGNDEVIKEQEFLIRSCGENEITFENLSEDKNFIEAYLWEFDLGNETVTSNLENPTITFPDIGSYFGQLIINPDSDDCRDTAKLFIEVFPEIIADYEYDYDTCVAGDVVFDDLSFSGSGIILDWEWDMNEEDTIKNAEHSYLFDTPDIKTVKLKVTDINDCTDTKIVDIPYFPIPSQVLVEPSTFEGCRPANITFNNLSIPISDAYDILWDFGDGGQDTVISPRYEYQETGIYSVGLEITSPLGCYTSREYPFWIQVKPSPIANFSYSPDPVTSNNSTVAFKDRSEDAISWQYIFNDEVSVFQPDVNYTFQDTGLQVVQLVVLHPSGCPDTLTQLIDVIPLASIFLPNAFSPNGDGINDLFKPKGNFFGVKDYELRIYNRWGEQIFETQDPDEGWNGRVLNVRNQSPPGVYVYKLFYTGPRGAPIVEEGFATIVR